MEKQQAQSNQLCVALKHEQTAKDNLRKELQIEASRCEALLAQERSHLSELQRSLEAEQGRSRELAEALHHERRLTERLSRRTQEKQVHEALLQKLKGQEARVLELEAALQTALQRALEAEARPCREEVKREQEVSAAPRPPVEAPQTLARRRERPARAQAEVEQPRAAQAEQAACKDTRPGAELRPSRTDADEWRRWQRDKEMLVSPPRPRLSLVWSRQLGSKLGVRPCASSAWFSSKAAGDARGPRGSLCLGAQLLCLRREVSAAPPASLGSRVPARQCLVFRPCDQRPLRFRRASLVSFNSVSTGKSFACLLLSLVPNTLFRCCCKWGHSLLLSSDRGSPCG